MNRLQILFGILVILATVLGKTIGDCKGPVFKINGVNYTREVLTKNLKSVESLSYDLSSNTLFFTYHSDDPVYTVLFGKFNLTTNEFETIRGVQYPFATYVDAKTNILYIQASGGIYKYNRSNKTAELYFADDYNIAAYTFMLFAKSDIVYVTTDPSWIVYKIENGVASKFKDLERTQVRSLVIDDNDDMYFSNENGLYRQKVGSQEAVYYKESADIVPFDGVAINYVGDVYAFAGSYGIYAVNKNTNVLEKIVDDTAHALTFDGGYNIVYSDYNNLFRLKPNNDPNCV